MMDKVQGEQTNAIEGEYSPNEALKLMLAGTPLEIMQEAAVEGFVVGRRTSSAQRAVAGRNQNQQPQTKTMTTQTLSTKFRKWLAHIAAAASASAALAQGAPADSPADAAQQSDRNSAPASVKREETIVLSPFVVTTEKDQGYFAENTLAGSRMRTNLSDLAASLSVITKQQMDDTASVDVNDMFRYEIGTEGALTYTPSASVSRGDGVADANAGSSTQQGQFSTIATANRLRGLGAPSFAINYYPAIAQVPIDSYNIESVEISRGPNSLLFGMGSPAGIVNQSLASANLRKNSAKVSIRVDDIGSHREQFAFNQVLLHDRLAIYGAFVNSEQAFRRKPSYDNTQRYYGAFTVKLPSKTTIRGNAEYYNNKNRRANSLTPLDGVTQWRLAGEPIYDALTKKITVSKTGQVVGPYILSAGSSRANEVRQYIESLPSFDAGKWNATKTSYNGVSIFGEAALTNVASPLFVPGINWFYQPTIVVQNFGGQTWNTFQPLGNQQYRTAWGTATNPAASAPLFPTDADTFANPVWSDIRNRYTTLSSVWTQSVGSLLGNYRYPGVTDKSVYDWEKVNTLAPNSGEDRNKTYNLELEQEIIPSQLYLNAGYFRQDFRSLGNFVLGQSNVTSLFVDTSKYLPDGTPNPFVGKPFVQVNAAADRFLNTEKDDHYRAMLAYTPDFTQHDGWLKWLGHHQILGMWNRQETLRSRTQQRPVFVAAGTDAGKYRYLANQNNNLDSTPTGWNLQGIGRDIGDLRPLFYLAGPNDPASGRVVSASAYGEFAGSTNVRVYDYATSSFQNLPMTVAYTNFDSPVVNQRLIDSISGAMTSYFWNDRLVTTFGVRKDKFMARSNTTGVVRDDSGAQVAPALTNAQKWVNGVLQEDLIRNRWQRWDRLEGTTRTYGGVLRPFRNRSSIESRAGNSLFWEFVQDFGISYNQSGNFNAPDAAQVDVFNNPLPKPTGEGKDYGIQFSLFKSKLFVRVTQFEALNLKERYNPGNSINRFNNLIDRNLFRLWSRTIALINTGYDPRLSTFPTLAGGLSAAEETAVQAAAEKIYQLPYNYYDNIGPIYATRTAKAKGSELQINYNPTRNWTMRLTASKTETINSDVLKEFDAWYAVRHPIWQAAKASTFLLPQYQQFSSYTRADGIPVNLSPTSFLDSYGYNPTFSDARLDSPNGWPNVQAYYDSVVQSQYVLLSDLNGQVAPGQRKYRAALITNYQFDRGSLKGFSVGGGQRWEDKAVIGYYGRSTGANKTPGFLDASDVKRPVYDKAKFYTDLWLAYTTNVFGDKYRMKVQLNVDNVFENGGLEATTVNYNGSPFSFRIVDPRVFKLQVSFDL